MKTKTVNELTLNEYVYGTKGEVLKVTCLVDHAESDLLRRVGFKDMTFPQKDVFVTEDLPRTDMFNLADYAPRKVGRPSHQERVKVIFE
ncbi:hypothetical protein [Paenibacillus tyrfis]|uniref:hypothetical protein n=1 Tax=Paenibacillus tyrfis TaxID=1501230 RepID=UPI000B59190C|nr:hypothetical protein [Paenibacillus tyrfis]